MNRWMKRITGLALALMITLVFCASSQAAYSVKAKWARFTATAGEDLTIGQVVSIKDSDGEAYKADANDAALRPAVGVVGLAADDGNKVEIITIGILRGWTSLSEGAFAYLSETAGAVTQSAPTWSQNIGVAISTTEYYFNFGAYLDTSSVTAVGTLAGASPITFEGATADANETTLAVTDPTADRTITLPDASGVPILSSAIPDAANAVSGAANGLVFEGATADAFETTVSATDPTADRSVVLPDAGGTVMLSSLATNGADAANAVTGASNGLVFEGATADAFETTVSATDPTADRSVVLPDAGGTVMLSSLATNGADAANAVTGASNGVVFEGATADDFETTVSATDPTADRSVVLPDAGGTVMLSSLATNAPDAANSVTGGSNGLVFEGGTADGFETVLTVEDPTADRTVTLPNYSGGLPVVIVQGTTQTSQGDASTIDVTGTDLSIAAGWLTAGKVIKWTIEGTITNGNAGDKSVELYLSDGDVLTLTLTGATGGDYIAEIYLYEHTDAANQDVYGSLLVNGQSVIFDRAAATKDVSGAVTAKLRLTLTDAADTITVESYRIETWTK